MNGECFLVQVGEVGELSEIFQWRGEVEPGLAGAHATYLAEVVLPDWLVAMERTHTGSG